MSEADFYISVVLLDCCRNWPLPQLKERGGKTRGGMSSGDASKLTAREGTMVMFATKDGDVALASPAETP